MKNFLTSLSLRLYLVQNITTRHKLLEATITERKDEQDSYKMAKYLNNSLTPIFLTLLFLEAASYLLYLNQVINVKHK